LQSEAAARGRRCGMPKAEPPPPPPPRPDPVKLQVKCVPWSTMDFVVNARLQEYTVANLEEIIKARHGDPIDNVELYKDNTSPENKLPGGATSTLQECSTTTIFYDYFPPLDPFMNRPVAGGLHATNQTINLRTFEVKPGEPSEPPVIEPAKLTWSKVAEHDPWKARELAEEARKEAERIAAEEAAAAAEAARIEAEKAEAKRKKEEEKRLKAEAAAKKKREEEEEAAKAEAERLRRLEEAAAKDPVKQAELQKKKAEAEAARKKKEAEEALAKLPPRKKGNAIGLFLGGTTREYYGLHNTTVEDPYLLIPKAKMMGEINDKGKIADLYNFKPQIEKYSGADEDILICKDEYEVYGDNGFVICLDEADKLHFMAHIAAGNGLPPPL